MSAVLNEGSVLSALTSCNDATKWKEAKTPSLIAEKLLKENQKW